MPTTPILPLGAGKKHACYYQKLPHGEYIPRFYCGKWACPVCQKTHVQIEVKRLKNALAQSGLAPNQWYMLTLGMYSEQRTQTPNDFAHIEQGFTAFIRNLSLMSKRKRGEVLSYWAVFTSPNGFHHCHTLLNYLPDSEFMPPNSYHSEYVSKYATKHGLTAHFEPFKTTYTQVCNYMAKNLIESLGSEFPTHFRRIRCSQNLAPKNTP